MFGSIVKHSLLELNKKEVKSMYATIIDDGGFSWGWRATGCNFLGGVPATPGCNFVGGVPGSSEFTSEYVRS